MLRPQLLASFLALAACAKAREVAGAGALATAAAAGQQISMGPWLLQPGDRQMTVAWVTEEKSAGRVWYGRDATDRLALEPSAGTDHRVVLGSLLPATRYRYRVEGAPEASFVTAPPAGSMDAPVEFLVYGDNRTNSGDHALVVRAAASERAQVALHTGDMVVNANEPQLWRSWFAEERDLLSTTPLVPTVGNHEMTDKGVSYAKYFQRPELPPYGSLDYGPVHVVVLDSFEVQAGPAAHAGGVSDAQKAWLEEDLRGVAPARHVWVLVHQGPFAHPVHERPGHGGSASVREALLAAAKIHRIEAVFAGHEHFYERGEEGGLRYFVLGGGGAPLEDPDATFPGVQAAQKALSYAVLDVCGCHAAGKVKDISGKVIDSFHLADCDTPCGLKAAGQP